MNIKLSDSFQLVSAARKRFSGKGFALPAGSSLCICIRIGRPSSYEIVAFWGIWENISNANVLIMEKMAWPTAWIEQRIFVFVSFKLFDHRLYIREYMQEVFALLSQITLRVSYLFHWAMRSHLTSKKTKKRTKYDPLIGSQNFCSCWRKGRLNALIVFETDDVECSFATPSFRDLPGARIAEHANTSSQVYKSVFIAFLMRIKKLAQRVETFCKIFDGYFIWHSQFVIRCQSFTRFWLLLPWFHQLAERIIGFLLQVQLW